jgi:hypothetical protein
MNKVPFDLHGLSSVIIYEAFKLFDVFTMPRLNRENKSNAFNPKKTINTLLKLMVTEQRTLQKDGYLSYPYAIDKKKSGSAFRRRHAVDRDYRLLHLNRQVRALETCLDSLKTATSKTAIMSHLVTLKSTKNLTKHIDNEISKLLKQIEPAVKRELSEKDSFDNVAIKAQFESVLSLRILEHTTPAPLERINQRIIDYLTRHQVALLSEEGFDIYQALTHFKIPFNEDTDIVSALIELLERPCQTIDEQNIPQIISETFVLHLLMFNYLHIYSPERDVDLLQNKKRVRALRDVYHREVRPKGEVGLFEPAVRGREEVFSTRRDHTFGICDDDTALEEFLDFHQFDFTPFKYRARPNLASPLVQYMKANGIPYIAGPSGTSADIIEAMQFLAPEMSDDDYQTYLNLLAASEVALGHHSLCEVILTAANAGVLPAVPLKDLGQPVWEQIEYKTVYKDFLTPEFKKTEAYKTLQSEYSWCLGGLHPIDGLIVEQKERQNKLAKKVIKHFDGKVASHTFQQAPYWEKLDIPQALRESPDFVGRLSKKNLTAIRLQTIDLFPEELNFLRFFMAQPIALTHYTDAAPAIKLSGKLLSNKALLRHGILFENSSMDDVDDMKNDEYIFFRFELSHRPFLSRFGEDAISIDGRAPHIFPHVFVTLTDMYSPLSASTIHRINYDGEIVRSGARTNIDETVEFSYPLTGECHIFNPAEYVFQGTDLMEGLARSLILELRRIGGVFRHNALSSFQNPRALSDSRNYPRLFDDVNVLLSQVFRPMGQLPREVCLSHVPFRISTYDNISDVFKRGNLMAARQALRLINFYDIDDEKEIFTSLIERGDYDLLSYLFKEGYYELEEEIIHQALQTLSDDQSYSKIEPRLLALLYEYGFENQLNAYRSNTGCTLLHEFARAECAPQLHLLIAHGFDPTVVSDAGMTFIDCLPDRMKGDFFEIEKIINTLGVSKKCM